MTKKVERKNLIYGLIFAGPAIVGLVMLSIIPMIASLYLSLTSYTGYSSLDFIGLENYKHMFSSEDLYFRKSLGVTAYYTLLNVPIFITFSFLFALLLNSKIKYKGFFRSVFYLPTIVPAVASSIIWLWMLNPTNGLVNQALAAVGLPTSEWLFSEATVIPTIVMIGLWGAGSTMVIFLAGLQGISNTYYEAVDIDGGNYFNKLVHITIPLMTPTIFFNSIMVIIGSFQVFTQAYIMTQGGPNNASLFYAYYIYREAFRNSNMGYACALSWILFIIIAFFSFIILKTQNRWVYYEGGE